MTGIAKMVWGWPWVGQRDDMGIQQDWRLSTHKTSAAQLIWIPVSTRIRGQHERLVALSLGRKFRSIPVQIILKIRMNSVVHLRL